jgi:hypothetical protein
VEINQGYQEMEKGAGVAFIIGSPRSGTTIFGNVLDLHSHVRQWYEPYFVWDRDFRSAPDDLRLADDCLPKVGERIRKDFSRYRKGLGAELVVDKSPRNSLKIPFILEIFPEAKFIHLLRDGRDTTLSIHKEWIRRRGIVKDKALGDRFNYTEAARVIGQWLSRQPFVRDKVRAFWFETHGHLFNKSMHLNRLRWNGAVGWGPRFRGWEEIYRSASLLQFNAHQWLGCVDQIQHCWNSIPQENRLEIRYEHFITKPRSVLEHVLGFLKLPSYDGFFESLPTLKKGNYNKWGKEFTKDQLAEIQPVLTPLLMELGYETNMNWHERP